MTITQDRQEFEVKRFDAFAKGCKEISDLCIDEDDESQEAVHNPEMRKLLQESVPFLQQFCKKYNTQLAGVSSTTEYGRFEWVYRFTDDTGGYTIAGVKRSLITIVQK
jgi:hypothetical protein